MLYALRGIWKGMGAIVFPLEVYGRVGGDCIIHFKRYMERGYTGMPFRKGSPLRGYMEGRQYYC